MKFGDHIDESAVPEWKDKYVNYKQGKKKLSQYAKRLEQESDEQHFLMYGNATGLTTYNGQTDECAVSDDAELRRVNAPYGATNSGYTPLQSELTKDFVTDWLIGEELAKCDEFYLWLLEKSKKKFEVLKEQIKLYHLQSNHESYIVGQPVGTGHHDLKNSYGSLSLIHISEPTRH